MDVKTNNGKLEITDSEGMSIRLDHIEVAELISYLRIKVTL